MAETNRFDPERPLGAGIGRLGREELIRLALALCSAAAESEGGAHGCIHPMNISLTPEGAALGPRASHAPGDYSTDELEYMAPELFWDRELSSAADVYSIGLVLYAGVTGGRLPFFPCGPESITNEQRAAALRRRLNGEAVAVPPVAGEKLGAVLRKALAFDRAERYANTAELAADLKDCVGEGDAAAMAAFGKPESELSEVERTMAGIIASFDDGEAAGKPEKPSGKQEKAPQPEKKPEVEYKVDKGFEQKPQKKSPPEKQPPKRGSRRGLYVVLAICVVVVIAALVVNAVWGLPGGGEDEAVSPSPSASAEPSPTPTPAPTPTPTPTPTPEPESTYQLFIENVTWEEARDLCVERGGHLVTISDADELATVTDLAETYGVSLVWIGFYRGEDGAIHWVDGEEIDYYIWGDGEPSGHDTDGTAEDYGLLWQTDSGWIYNDSRNDPISAYPGIYSGNIAYICEYDG
ncbi:MAG TPA: hypothetical protein IAB77_02215 [Candidatus Scatomorpha intestinavium]|uniref:Protein kinase domain-containing protein n=1 Tax=Candidatus Scatomorpha intestinavium TaxID=2840922 RepID=A0A9D0ZD09_9FIRM|nr:hypothetical protein [Candidatus Scatomorpha intestinavium]